VTGRAAAVAPLATAAIIATAATAAAVLLGATGAAAPRRSGGPDVVLVTIDTLRYDAVGFDGNRTVETPLLDRLAAGGRVFTDAHAHNVVTLPSHTNILTGLYPYQHGVRDNSGFTLAKSVPTLATYLHRAGYATGAFVGAYPLDRSFGLDHDFDVYDDRYPRGSSPDEFVIAERRGDRVVAPALAWWNARRGRPRFLWVHLYDPHAAYDPPEPFASRFKDHPYLGEVSAVDSFLQPLLAPLLAGREPPALVVVTADHGEALGDHGELTHGLFAYESTLKVPLVIWGPGVAPARDARPARHVDLCPTILAAVGVPVPKGLPGRSLLAPAASAPQPPATASYFESLSTSLNRGWAPQRGLIERGRKFIALPLPELYDLAADPGERHNLIDRDRRLAQAMARELPAESVWPPRKGAASAEAAARLRSLGYAVGSPGGKAAYGPEDDPKRLIGVDHQLQQAVDAYSRGRYDEAARLAGAVVKARPDLAEGYEHLALALSRLERREEAIRLLQGAVARGVAPASLRLQLGLALSEGGRAREAVAVLEPLGQGGDAAALDALGIALSDAGRHADAVAVLERAAENDPGNPKTYETLGVVELRRERLAAARRDLEKALAMNDRLPISWNTLGVVLYRSAGAAPALDAWEKAVALDPRQYDALFNIGLVAAQAGRREQARRALERFVASAPRERFGDDLAKARAMLAELGR